MTIPLPASNFSGLENIRPENLARTLRHEMGDFLQKVYASVAILQGRLPTEWKQERDILARLRMRAELCRDLLDGIQDLLCPLSLACEPLNLGRMGAELASDALKRYPHLEILFEEDPSVTVLADPRRIVQASLALLTNALEAAQRRIELRIQTNAGEVELRVTDDGPGVAPELVDHLFKPFFSTRAGHGGLGLALASKIVALHGGRIYANNLVEGGFQSGFHLRKKVPESQSQ